MLKVKYKLKENETKNLNRQYLSRLVFIYRIKAHLYVLLWAILIDSKGPNNDY